jgi:transcriptional regulator with XRE-family HTH domain
MTLKEYRVNLGWSTNKLAKEAGLAHGTVVSAEAGEIITAATAKAIADALSKAYGYTINVTDIKGLNIR